MIRYWGFIINRINMFKEMNNNVEFKRVFKWAGWAFLMLSLFLAVQTIDALRGLGDVNPSYNSIAVTGEGEAVSIPDIATFTFSVSSDAKTVGDAQNNVTEKMEAILATLKSQGIEDKDIKTTNYSVYPKYTYAREICNPTYCPPAKQTQDGYTANHNVMVKVRKIDEAGKALGAVGDKGATNISSVSFTTDDPDQAKEEARALAIKDAREKAENLADALGVRLVRVVSFYDNTGATPYYREAYGGDGVSIQNAKAPTLPAGENKVTANVTVQYEIR